MAKNVPHRKRRVTTNKAREPGKRAPVTKQKRIALTPRASNERIAPTVARATVPKTKLVPAGNVTSQHLMAKPPF